MRERGINKAQAKEARLSNPTLYETDCKRIIRILAEDAIAAGYTLSVHDGEAFPVKRSSDADIIVAATFSTDSDTLVYRHTSTPQGPAIGSVLLVYGNLASELIADNNVVLDDLGLLKRAEAEQTRLENLGR